MKMVFNVRSVSLSVKRQVHEKVLVAMVPYGAETRGMKKVERRYIHVMEMKCIQSMCGVTRLDCWKGARWRR